MKVYRLKITPFFLLISVILFPNFSFSQTPQIVSTTPSFNEIAGSSNPEISVEFNVPMESTSFDSISFSVFGERSAYHTGEIKFLNENRTVSFISNNNFNAGERVTVNLSHKLVSLTNDTLKGFTWSFLIPAKPKLLNFSSPIEYGGGGYSMQCIDMNNDGSPDIITSSGVILINDGNGKFPSHWNLDDADEFYPIIIDDFNRDGYLDVFYGGTNGLTLGLGDGEGSFTKSYYPWWFLGYTSVDINSDGYPDILGFNSSSDNSPYDSTSYWAIALNDCSGHFNDTVGTKKLTGSFQGISSSDIDNDGDMDVLIISRPAVTPGPVISGLDGLAVFKNDGEGVFDQYQLYSFCNNFTSPEHLFSSDFNNDGLIDIAVLGYGGGIMLNMGNGIYSTCYDTTYVHNFWDAELSATFTGGDFNGDSWVDLAVSGFGFPFEPTLPKEYTVLDNCNSYFRVQCGDNVPFTDSFGTSEILIYANSSADLNNNGYLDLIHCGTGTFVTLSIDTITSVDDNFEQPSNFYLYQNYPNPFNPTTTIQYDVKEKGFVQLKVFDILGKEVADLVNEVKEIGIYASQFNASTLPSGIYFYSIRVNDFVSTKKMILMK